MTQRAAIALIKSLFQSRLKKKTHTHTRDKGGDGENGAYPGTTTTEWPIEKVINNVRMVSRGRERLSYLNWTLPPPGSENGEGEAKIRKSVTERRREINSTKLFYILRI